MIFSQMPPPAVAARSLFGDWSDAEPASDGESPTPLNGDPTGSENRRVLVIDDTLAIHADYRKILSANNPTAFAIVAASMFGESVPEEKKRVFEIDCASQGAEGVELMRAAKRAGRPYAVAFVDMLMPPGLDGIETAAQLWEISPDLQVVICTAYSQESWPDALSRLGHTDKLLILRKPFDPVEVQQLAHALTEKWRLGRQARFRLSDLESHVCKRTFDLTAANLKLREQAALLDKAQEAIIVWDLDDIVHFWNKSAERLYGLPPEGILGCPVNRIFPDAMPQFLLAKKLTLSCGSWHGELPHTTADGRTLSIEQRWTLVRNDGGQPKSILAILTDVTEKKALSARLVRTQRLESIGTLAGGMAHDLNNALTPIVVGIEMLRAKCGDDEEQLKLLEVIDKSAQRGIEMVSQVLSFSRGAGGERRLVQPRHFIGDVQKIVRNTFPKNIPCLTTVARDLWNVRGDAGQLHQALLNLCVNARDAMPSGGELTISAENVHIDDYYAAMNHEATCGLHVLIEVRDSGAGIPEESMEKIFDPFFTTKEQGRGAGLGLSASLGIARSHGGFFQVSSAAGSGASFRMYLPADTATTVHEPEAGAFGTPRGRGETILVVEDEEPIRAMTAQILEGSGYRILTAADGVEGLALFARERAQIAAVLTDLAMPVMDGAMMVQVLVRMAPGVKIIAMSGLSAPVPDPALSRRLRHFLPKPYSAETLLNVLAQTLHDSDLEEVVCVPLSARLAAVG